MENTKNQFVIYPHEENSEPQPDLDPKDKLIYLTIRRYMNKKTMECYPSYAEITRCTGAAAKTIKKCVDNLVKEGYLETRKEGRRIFYKFNNKKKFEAFSYNFLDNPNLTFTEKAYIVATQQYMYKDEDTEEGRVSFTNKELSERINMPVATISKCNKELERKGYLSGSSSLTKSFNLRELDQLFILKFRDIDQRIETNTEDISKLKRENEEMKRTLEEIQNKLNIPKKTNFYL